MPDVLATKISGRIKSAVLVTGRTGAEGLQAGDCAQAELTEQLQAEREKMVQLRDTLEGIIAKFSQLCSKTVSEHREEIARLAVEIANKILMRKIEQGDYQIEDIIKEAMKIAPSKVDVVVHLNPTDYAGLTEQLKSGQDNGFGDVKLIADGNIGRAECLIETPKGLVESLINEHLQTVAEALKKV